MALFGALFVALSMLWYTFRRSFTPKKRDTVRCLFSFSSDEIWLYLCPLPQQLQPHDAHNDQQHAARLG